MHELVHNDNHMISELGNSKLPCAKGSEISVINAYNFGTTCKSLGCIYFVKLSIKRN